MTLMLTDKEQLLIMLKKLLLTEASVGQQSEVIEQLKHQNVEAKELVDRLCKAFQWEGHPGNLISTIEQMVREGKWSIS